MEDNKTLLKAIITEHIENMNKDISEQLGDKIQDQHWYLANTFEYMENILIEHYLNAIDWVPEPEPKQDALTRLAWIRTDILRRNLAVPVGNLWYGEQKPLLSRWISEEDFQVHYNCEWRNASSIDWDFTDKLVKEKDNGS